jgi:hypothetical protein
MEINKKAEIMHVLGHHDWMIMEPKLLEIHKALNLHIWKAPYGDLDKPERAEFKEPLDTTWDICIVCGAIRNKSYNGDYWNTTIKDYSEKVFKLIQEGYYDDQLKQFANHEKD